MALLSSEPFEECAAHSGPTACLLHTGRVFGGSQRSSTNYFGHGRAGAPAHLRHASEQGKVQIGVAHQYHMLERQFPRISHPKRGMAQAIAEAGAELLSDLLLDESSLATPLHLKPV